MNEENDKKTVEQQLEEEMKKWKAEVDAVKVQAHLGAMDVRDKAQPYLDELDQKLTKAKKELDAFGSASEGAWQELSKGLKLSFKALQQSSTKAKEHFEPKEG